MSREIVYMLQTYDMVGPKTFRFDRPAIYSDLQAAMSVVEDTRGKAGLVIHEVSGDPELLMFDQPKIVHTMGAVPAGLVPRREDARAIAADSARARLPLRESAGRPHESLTLKPVRI